MVWNHIYQSVDVNIGIGTFKHHLKSHLLSIISWIIIVPTVCVFPLYVFRIYRSTRHELITGAPYALLCTLTLAPWIEYVYQLWGHINIIVSAPFVTVSVLCCICIVYCKAYSGNKLLFCSVLFCSTTGTNVHHIICVLCLSCQCWHNPFIAFMHLPLCNVVACPLPPPPHKRGIIVYVNCSLIVYEYICLNQQEILI